MGILSSNTGGNLPARKPGENHAGPGPEETRKDVAAVLGTTDSHGAESLNPSQIWDLVLQEHPSLIFADFAVQTAKETRILEHTGGYFRPPKKQGERPTIVARAGDNNDFAGLFESRKASVAIIAKLLGVDTMTPRALRLFIILHEIGHAYDFRKRFPTFSPNNKTTPQFHAEWKALTDKEMEGLPVPNVNPSLFEIMYREGKLDDWLRYKGMTYEELHAAQNQTYRKLPTEAFADNFAADFMKRHPELWR